MTDLGFLSQGVCAICASLVPFGGIDTSWSFEWVVYGACDASKWCQSRRVVLIPLVQHALSFSWNTWSGGAFLCVS